MQHSYFGYKKSNGKWKLVQDLWIINEVVVPLHPVVPNPYTLLSEIPEPSQIFLSNWFERCPLFSAFGGGKSISIAFEEPVQPASQLTWTVLPQGFCNSPHLFGQSLSRDLQNFNSSEAVMLQYVDDILLCAVIEEACSLFPVVVNR